MYHPLIVGLQCTASCIPSLNHVFDLLQLKGELGNLTDKPTEEELEQAQLIEEARQEQEAERKAKHDKMEAEREKERQRIRDKVGGATVCLW